MHPEYHRAVSDLEQCPGANSTVVHTALTVQSMQVGLSLSVARGTAGRDAILSSLSAENSSVKTPMAPGTGLLMVRNLGFNGLRGMEDLVAGWPEETGYKGRRLMH